MEEKALCLIVGSPESDVVSERGLRWERVNRESNDRAGPAPDLAELRGEWGAAAMVKYGPLWQSYERRALQLAKAGVVDDDLEQYRWLLEEVRVQLYAQELSTPVPVSVKRLQKM